MATLLLAQISHRKPTRGWLHNRRNSLGLSQQKVAQKISMVRQSYADLESAEERGAISLASLERAARAMGCDFVYALVPRDKRSSHPRTPSPARKAEVKPIKMAKPTAPVPLPEPTSSAAFRPEGELPTFLK